MKPGIHLNKLSWCLLVFVCLVSALTYDYVDRMGSVPVELRYIPTESAIVLYTEDIGSVWNAARPHYDRITGARNGEKSPLETDAQARGTNPERDSSMVREAIDDLKSMLKERDIPIQDLEALRGYGIDTQRRLTFGWYAVADSHHFIALVPVTDVKMTELFLTRLFEEEPETEDPLIVGDLSYEVKNIGEILTLAPESEWLIIGSDREVLSNALLDPAANLSFHRNDDILRSSQKALVGAQRNDMAVIASWRLTKDNWFQRAAMGITFAQDQMAVLLQVHAKTGFLRIIDDFLTPPQKADANFNHVVPNTLMQATLRDSALSEYIKFIQTNGGSEIRDQIKNFFGGVLLKLENMDSASGLTFATLGYTNGLPDVVMGLAGKRLELENLVSHMQVTKRLERDEEILEKVLAKTENQKSTTPENPIPLLENRGLLVETSQALWHRYKISNGKIIEHDLEQTDFGQQTGYLYEAEGFRCRYLLPAIDANDMAHRFTRNELKNMDPETLKGDRYRLCAAIDADTLWIGSDGVTLGRFMTNRHALESNMQGSSLQRPAGNRRNKIRVFFDMNSIVTEGLLNLESEVDAALEQYLFDFVAYANITFEVFPMRSRQEIWISCEFNADD